MTKLTEYLRPLAVKVIARGVLYGLTALLGWMAIDTAQAAGPSAAIGEGLGTVAVLALAAFLDRWNHRKDLAEPPA